MYKISGGNTGEHCGIVPQKRSSYTPAGMKRCTGCHSLIKAEGPDKCPLCVQKDQSRSSPLDSENKLSSTKSIIEKKGWDGSWRFMAGSNGKGSTKGGEMPKSKGSGVQERSEGKGAARDDLIVCEACGSMFKKEPGRGARRKFCYKCKPPKAGQAADAAEGAQVTASDGALAKNAEDAIERPNAAPEGCRSSCESCSEGKEILLAALAALSSLEGLVNGLVCTNGEDGSICGATEQMNDARRAKSDLMGYLAEL